MTSAEIAFWTSTTLLTIALSIIVYPGVRRHAASARASVIASIAASSLAAATMGVLIAAMTHAMTG